MSQECDIVHLLCHCCKKSWISDYLVPCKTPFCGRLFCYKCLTSRYKYSKAKAARLPTPSWRCPVCTHKCHCEECQTGDFQIRQKSIRKPKIKKFTYRKRKINKYRKAVSKFYLRADANTGTPLNDQESNEIFSPKPRKLLPPISSNLFLHSSVF